MYDNNIGVGISPQNRLLVGSYQHDIVPRPINVNIELMTSPSTW